MQTEAIQLHWQEHEQESQLLHRAYQLQEKGIIDYSDDVAGVPLTV